MVGKAGVEAVEAKAPGDQNRGLDNYTVKVKNSVQWNKNQINFISP